MSTLRRSEWPLERKVYVGGLPDRVVRSEIEDAFGHYGRIENVWVARQPPGFAFILFEDERDARDAVRGLDGGYCCGVRVRVEMSSGMKRPKRFDTSYREERFGYTGRRGGYDERGGYGGGYDDRSDRRRGRSRSRSPRRSRRSPSRSRSRSRSPSARKSVSRSPDRPARRDKSRSKSSASRSRSPS